MRGMALVTPGEMARELGISPKTLRAWLRSLKDSGDARLAGHRHNERWEFEAALARELVQTYRAGSRVRRASPPRSRTDTAAGETSIVRPATARVSSGDPGHRVRETWMGVEYNTLEDLLRPGLLAVCVGINPSPVSVAAGHYYQGTYGQRFFSRLRRVGLLDAEHEGFEDDAAFAWGVGFTDLVKRPTRGEDDLEPAEREHGRGVLEAKLQAAGARLVIFVFKSSAATLFGPFAGNGFVDRRIGAADVFVMPGPTARTDVVDAAVDQLARRVEELRGGTA